MSEQFQNNKKTNNYLKLKEDPFLKSLFDDLSAEQFELLKNDIQVHGQLESIKVLPDGTIVDGHQRYRACKELGIEPKYEILNLSREEAVDYALALNLKKRHASPFQRIEALYKAKIKPLKETAKQRKLLNLKQFSTEASRDASEKTLKEVYQELASKYGFAVATLERTVKVIEEAPEWVKTFCREGTWSIFEAYQFVVLLGEVPKHLRSQFEDDIRENIITLKDLKKIIVKTKAVIDVLMSIPESKRIEIARELNLKEKLWTKKLNLKEVEDKVKEKCGFSNLVTCYVQGADAFKNDIDAVNWAHQFAGVYDVKQTFWCFEIPKENVKEFIERTQREKNSLVSLDIKPLKIKKRNRRIRRFRKKWKIGE